MTEAERIIDIFNAGTDEMKSAMLRGLKIYLEGTEQQKQILDRIATKKMNWTQVIETIEQAESAK